MEPRIRLFPATLLITKVVLAPEADTKSKLSQLSYEKRKALLALNQLREKTPTVPIGFVEDLIEKRIEPNCSAVAIVLKVMV